VWFVVSELVMSASLVLVGWETAKDPANPTQPASDVTDHLLYLSPANDANLPGTPTATITATGATGTYSPTLVGDATYTWRVDEKLSDLSIITGPVWTFSTVPSVPTCMGNPGADVSGPTEGVPDCVVDLYDLAYLAGDWLGDGFCPGSACP
jgi:hypothetical protein